MVKAKQAIWAGAGLLLLAQSLMLGGLGRSEADTGQPPLDSRIAALEQTVSKQQDTIAALQAKLEHVSVSPDGKDITISGANLHIVNGLGSTDAQPTNGLGNLIIGYNESRKEFHMPDLRTGSHNLVIGSQNNYTSYSGMVIGNFNSITAPFATVNGGYENTASGFSSTVIGGSYNSAGGRQSAVSGGLGNAAKGALSTVVGGYNVVNADAYGWSGGGNYAPGTGPGKFRYP